MLDLVGYSATVTTDDRVLSMAQNENIPALGTGFDVRMQKLVACQIHHYTSV